MFAIIFKANFITFWIFIKFSTRIDVYFIIYLQINSNSLIIKS